LEPLKYGTIVLSSAEAGLSSKGYRIVEGQYLRDILDQPRALSSTLAQLQVPAALQAIAERLRDGELRRVVLTGMGASLHALYPLDLQLTACGYSVVIEETSELIHYLPGLIAGDTLVVAVSQSGESAEILRLLEINGGRASVVAVTNESNSTLARRANACLLTAAGQEFSVSCKTYVTALMALRLLAALLCAQDLKQAREQLEPLASVFASYLHSWKDHALQVAADLEGARQLFLLGRGASLAAARSGALIVKESARFHAEGMSGAAFRHGPFEMLSAETFAVVYAGAEATRALQENLARDIRSAGARAAWIAEDAGAGAWRLPMVQEELRPLVEILPAQMVTLALAAQRGIEAGRFAIATKVTTTE
jgi:glutamine---fructose-6-phosphate transaminase (isomerizing)